MGITGGGVWKTSNAGHHWENISDGYFKTSSVGGHSGVRKPSEYCLCGYGRARPSGGNDLSWRRGVQITDAGKTWQHIGLKATQHISRIVIHPNNPEVVWVAAQGPCMVPLKAEEYIKPPTVEKHGKTLYTNSLSGASELSIDVHNPQVLYAAMWEHIRKPWKVISGGSWSGLYKSVDGGETWKPIHNGLPKAKGKMAIAVSRANPTRCMPSLKVIPTKNKEACLFLQMRSKMDPS